MFSDYILRRFIMMEIVIFEIVLFHLLCEFSHFREKLALLYIVVNELIDLCCDSYVIILCCIGVETLS